MGLSILRERNIREYMLRSAEFTREVQKRANDSYKRYCEFKEEVSKLIFFASCIGNGNCDFETPYSDEYRMYLEKIAGELVELGYEVNSFVSKKSIKLHISW